MGKVLAAAGPEDAYLSLVSYWDDAESMVIGAGANVSIAVAAGGRGRPSTASPSRCCGSTWWATCPTTS